VTTTAIRPQTWADLARSVAWEFGIDLSFDDADYILWEHTGFPSFWEGKPRECCTAQLRAYFGSLP
jgi:hypothetical protein